MLNVAKSNVNTTVVSGAGHQILWDGGLAEAEMSGPGGSLMAALLYRAQQLGHSLPQIAEEMKVSYGYIIQLRTGMRAPESVSPEFIKAAAQYLGAPPETVLLLSGNAHPGAGPGAGRMN